MRNEYEIEKELERFVDRNYFERHRVLKENGTIDEFLNSEDPIEVGGAKRVLEFNAELREKYKDDQLFQEEFDSFKCGVLKGKIAALRWVGGIDWDDIDPHITHDEFYTSKQKRNY